MGIEGFFHMNGGEDERSYAKNSSFQKDVISMINPIVAEALADCLVKTRPKSFGIADLGCSSGPNSLIVVSSLVHRVQALCSEKGFNLPELRVALNDLFSNDFNSIFASLPDMYCKLTSDAGFKRDGCFISAVPGSFYGRLFPRNTLHFVHSSFSLHWLSQVPEGLRDLNKGNVYISDKSPDRVFQAYLAQFESDFRKFLAARAAEMVAGGRMVLYFIGRNTPKPSDEGDDKYALMSRALLSMASEGLIQEEKIDSYNAPYYAPSVDEVKKAIEEEGSFVPNQVEVFQLNWEQDLGDEPRGRIISRIMRAANESMLKSHFGDGVMEELSARLSKLIDAATPRSSYLLVVSATKSAQDEAARLLPQ